MNEHNATPEELAYAAEHKIPVVQAIASLRYGMTPASRAVDLSNDHRDADRPVAMEWSGAE